MVLLVNNARGPLVLLVLLVRLVLQVLMRCGTCLWMVGMMLHGEQAH